MNDIQDLFSKQYIAQLIQNQGMNQVHQSSLSNLQGMLTSINIIQGMTLNKGATKA